jgi:hypothetical protein
MKSWFRGREGGGLRTESLNIGRVSKLSVSPWSHNGGHPSVKTIGGYVTLLELLTCTDTYSANIQFTYIIPELIGWLITKIFNDAVLSGKWECGYEWIDDKKRGRFLWKSPSEDPEWDRGHGNITEISYIYIYIREMDGAKLLWTVVLAVIYYHDLWLDTGFELVIGFTERL